MTATAIQASRAISDRLNVLLPQRTAPVTIPEPCPCQSGHPADECCGPVAA